MNISLVYNIKGRNKGKEERSLACEERDDKMHLNLLTSLIVPDES